MTGCAPSPLDSGADRPRREDPIFLGISPNRGAAIVFTDEALEGTELEIRKAGGPWAGIRAEVERHDIKEAICFAAVFPGLAAGDYQVRVGGLALGVQVHLPVAGGEVTELTWPGP
jgi:hypothetical protein